MSYKGTNQWQNALIVYYLKLSNTITTVFDFNFNFYFFVNFNIYRYILLIISKQRNRGEKKRSKCNSITQCPIFIKFATNIQERYYIFKIMKKFFLSFFFFFFFVLFCFVFVLKKVSFLNYVAKYTNWLRPGYRGNKFQNPASLLCAYLFYVCTPNKVVSFLSYICSRVQPIKGLTMATRIKQPLFFTTWHHGLQHGIQHSSADIEKVV